MSFEINNLQDGARSIHTAARYGHVGIINTLLQKGEKVDVTTNVSFARFIFAILTVIVMQKKKKTGHVSFLSRYLQDNYTALHIAVESCKPAVVETLLGYGADVHVRGN